MSEISLRTTMIVGSRSRYVILIKSDCLLLQPARTFCIVMVVIWGISHSDGIVYTGDLFTNRQPKLQWHVGLSGCLPYKQRWQNDFSVYSTSYQESWKLHRWFLHVSTEYWEQLLQRNAWNLTLCVPSCDRWKTPVGKHRYVKKVPFIHIARWWRS